MMSALFMRINHTHEYTNMQGLKALNVRQSSTWCSSCGVCSGVVPVCVVAAGLQRVVGAVPGRGVQGWRSCSCSPRRSASSGCRSENPLRRVPGSPFFDLANRADEVWLGQHIEGQGSHLGENVSLYPDQHITGGPLGLADGPEGMSGPCDRPKMPPPCTGCRQTVTNDRKQKSLVKQCF